MRRARPCIRPQPVNPGVLARAVVQNDFRKGADKLAALRGGSAKTFNPVQYFQVRRGLRAVGTVRREPISLSPSAGRAPG